jgi:hypothetical protein
VLLLAGRRIDFHFSLFRQQRERAGKNARAVGWRDKTICWFGNVALAATDANKADEEKKTQGK